MKLLKISMLLCLFAAGSGTLTAQKFGHLNTGNLLVSMPETKVADDKLKIYQDSLVKIGEEKAKALEADFMAFMKLYNEGGVPPVEAQKKDAEFKKRQQDLANLEEQVIAEVTRKREELLAPIVERVDKAIKAVGKEGGYTMIFDTSIFNTILFAQESSDVEPLVKQKLGVQ
jgi:outer membrane protein